MLKELKANKISYLVIFACFLFAAYHGESKLAIVAIALAAIIGLIYAYGSTFLAKVFGRNDID